MRKPPADCFLRKMTEAEFAEFMALSITDFAADKAASDKLTEEAALKLSRDSFHKLLPHGLATTDMHVFSIREGAGEEALGWIWLGVSRDSIGPRAYVWDIKIDAAQRGRGLGRAAMVLAEMETRRLGLHRIQLHVFGHNARARQLYESLDYRTTNLWMLKTLE